MAKNSMIDRLSKNKALKESVFTKNQDAEIDFINTGALVLNVLFSGRLQGGIPVGKISSIAAPSSLGKSFVGMKIAKNAQKKGKDWIVIYMDTEMAFDFDFADSIGIDLDRLLVIQNNHIEEVQKQIMAVTAEFSKEERKKVLIVVDSWGGLVTSKTVDDAKTGKDVTDMTVAKKKNTLSKLMTSLGVTIFVVNQVYDCQVAGTMVKTDSGEKAIEVLKEGDKVLTTDGFQDVLETVEHEDAHIFEIELEDGSTIKCTEGHKFIIRNTLTDSLEWIPAGALSENMEILCESDLEEIKSKELAEYTL